MTVNKITTREYGRTEKGLCADSNGDGKGATR